MSLRNAGGGTRTHTGLLPLDFESSASASFTTPAIDFGVVITTFNKCQVILNLKNFLYIHLKKYCKKDFTFYFLHDIQKKFKIKF